MIVAEANFIRRSNQRSNIEGSVVFSQYDPDFVRVDIDLTNVPVGTHGIHVHEKPIKNFNAKDPCKQACAHFNGTLRRWAQNIPDGVPHGSWSRGTYRHVGDLCNNITSFPREIKTNLLDLETFPDELNVTENLLTTNDVTFSYYDDLISLIPDHPHNIVGRSVVIHEDPDDEGLLGLNSGLSGMIPVDKIIESRITGNAGKRIACANIEYI